MISQLWDGEHVSVSPSGSLAWVAPHSDVQSAVISCTGCWTPNRLCCFRPGVKCHPPPAESTARRRCTACGRDNTSEPNNYIKVMERRNVLAISAGVQQQRGTCREGERELLSGRTAGLSDSDTETHSLGGAAGIFQFRRVSPAERDLTSIDAEIWICVKYQPVLIEACREASLSCDRLLHSALDRNSTHWPARGQRNEWEIW